MTAFLIGVVFGIIFAGSIFVSFVTWKHRHDEKFEGWEDPFEEQEPAPVPVVIHHSLVKRREISL